MNEILRCSKCNLPVTYPEIRIEGGICNFCRNEIGNIQDQQHYLGRTQLKKDIADILSKKPKRNTKYDCMVAFSGGMDSTYLLYVLAHELGLRVLAVSLKHKYLPNETIDNIINISKVLDVDHVFIDNPYLDDCADYFITKWSTKPSYQSLISFCTGCRYGLNRIIPKFAVENGISIICTGETPIEETDFKVNLTMINPNKPSQFGLICGYGSELIKNPSYLHKPNKLIFQLQEFSSKKYLDHFLKTNNIIKIRPFFNYIRWDERIVKETLKKLNWNKGLGGADGWRSDCVINIVRQYYYKRFLGFDESDVRKAQLLRLGQASIDEEHDLFVHNSEAVRSVLTDYFQLDYDSIEERIKI